MFKVGDTITADWDFYTGHAPGEKNFLNKAGTTAVVKGVRGDAFDLDFSGSGGGTGWYKGEGLRLASAPRPGGAPAPGGVASGGPRIDFANQQQSVVDQKKQALINYFNSLPSVEGRFKGLLSEHGVNDQQALVDALTKEIMGGTDRLEALDGDITDRTGGMMVTEAQRRGIVNREREPIEEYLNKVMRNQEYQQVGLQGKQQMVQQLMALMMEDDERKAKPYEIDLSEQRSAAERLIAAFGGDQDSRDSQAAAAAARAHEIMMDDRDFQQQKDLALFNKSLSGGSGGSSGGSGGGGSSARTSSGAKPQSSTITKEVLTNNKIIANNHWNDIVRQYGSNPTQMKQAIYQRSSAYGTEGRDYLLNKLSTYKPVSSGSSWY